MTIEDLNNMEDVFITIDNEVFEIYSVRQDGKIYFWNVENTDQQYNSNMRKLHNHLSNGDWALV